MSSRWADDAADKDAKRREKEEKQRRKAEKERLRAEAVAEAQRKREEEQRKAAAQQRDESRPAKRQRTAGPSATEEVSKANDSENLYHLPTTTWKPCRSVDQYETLNAIEEGSYGWVSRARSKSSQSIVALKKLKMDNLNEGFPTTALREIQTLKAARGHANVVQLHEVAAGPDLNAIYLVMEFVEHDLKTLQEDMSQPFLPSETKALMLQITAGLAHLHANWILHRDLKTSNILLTNHGTIKLADFGMARYYGDPPPQHMTQLVVTLWYRAPELLLGTEKYDHAIDIWSLGCVFAELVANEPILQGRNEVDQLAKTFALCGVPNEKRWPRFRSLPNARGLKIPSNAPQESRIRSRFGEDRSDSQGLSRLGTRLLDDLLQLDPLRRPDAAEVLEHPWFEEDPRPKSKEMFPTFPSRAGQERRRRQATPHAPRGEVAPKIQNADLSSIFAGA